MLLTACSPEGDFEITETREVVNIPASWAPGASGAQRFGAGPSTRPSAGSSGSSAPAENPFLYDLPSGWEELPATESRLVNLRPAGNPQMECTLTLLGGDGGGLADNANRWRKQMGLAPITSAEVDALPRGLFLGTSATVIDLRGAYSGMGSTAQDDWGLFGYILPTPQFTLFAKMTGPADAVSAERSNFEGLFATLTVSEPGAPDEEDHSGHNHAPGEGHGEPESEPVQAQMNASGVSSASGSFSYDLPEGWSEGRQGGIRNVNLKIGASECYIIALVGDGGGLAANLTRWRGELGLDPVTQEDIDAMQLVEILGVQSPLLDVTGDYQGMASTGGGANRVLAVPLIRSGKSIFVKMVGPDAEVASQRDNFIAFVASLTEQ